MAGCMTVSQEDPVTRVSRSSLGDYATHLPKNDHTRKDLPVL